MEFTEEIIIDALNKYPGLVPFGLNGDPNDPEYPEQRNDLLHDRKGRETALKYLKGCTPTNGFSKKRSVSSYALKHHMEGSHDGYKPYKGCHVSNGTAILACLLKGFDIKHEGPDNPNAQIAIKEPKPNT